MNSRYDQLAAKLDNLPDPGLRQASVRQTLSELDARGAAELLDDAWTAQAREPNPRSNVAWSACAHALLPSVMVERLEEVARTAERLGLDHVVDMVREATDEEEESKLRVPKFGADRPLTLGERKSLARKSDPELIKRVVRDPSPDVIAIALGNPILTETDVVRVCAARPVKRETLRVVAAHPKWSTRYRVRNAIVRNPYCLPRVACLYVPLLRSTDLREVWPSAELSRTVRLTARRILQQRVGSRPPQAASV